jgi:hypothetical protein
MAKIKGYIEVAPGVYRLKKRPTKTPVSMDYYLRHSKRKR